MRRWIPALLVASCLPLAAEALTLVQTIVPGPFPASMTRLGGPKWGLASTFEPLNADRYALVGTFGYDWPQESKKANAVGFPILDLQAKRVSVVTVPVDEGYKPGSDLIAYDPGRQSGAMIVMTWQGNDRVIEFVHWDLAGNRLDWRAPLATTTERQMFRTIGMDHAKQALYFMVEGHPTRKIGNEVHATEAVLQRFDLASRTIDWTANVKLPGRVNHLIGSLDVAASPDFKKLVVTEYSEPGYGKVSPPQAWVVDVSSSAVKALTIPMTPYGVAFDRQNRYLVIGSNAEAKLVRYNLATNKADMVVGTVGRVQTLALSSDNKQLYVFTKGRTMEVRDWPSLKVSKTMVAGTVIAGQTHFNGEGIAVLPDGKHAVMRKTEAPYGFTDEDEFFSLGMGAVPAKKP
jgi:hypothetical protein